jgi:hypothetical protein
MAEKSNQKVVIKTGTSKKKQRNPATYKYQTTEYQTDKTPTHLSLTLKSQQPTSSKEINLYFS